MADLMEEQHPRKRLGQLPLAAAVLLPSAYKFAQRFAPVLPYEVQYMIQDKGITNQQIFRAMAASIEVVFPSYLLFLASADKFQILISSTDASSSISHFGASELGQALIAEGFSIRVLLYISMAMVMLSVLICSVLPKDPKKEGYMSDSEPRPPLLSFVSVCRLKGSLSTVKETWRDPFVQLLSFWWAGDVALYAMVATYMLNLFEEIDPSSTYSGHVVAATEVTNLIGALSAIPLSKLVSRDGGVAVYVSGSVLIGILVISMPYTGALWVAYPGYILLAGVNRALLCLVQVQCARCVANREYVLLFSLNTLAGRLIQTALQAGIELIAVSILHQYYLFGALFLVVASVFSLLYLYKLWTVEDDLYHPLLDEEPLLA